MRRPLSKMKVRRVNPVRSLVTHTLNENGMDIFGKANVRKEDGMKVISSAVVGLGNHGTEMVKALAWFCQMDGYTVKINAFDRDKRARDRFTSLCPELMSEEYNGVRASDEGEFSIKIHPDTDVFTSSFDNIINTLTDLTMVFISLGNDGMNIDAAVKLRMLCERMNAKPEIYAVISDSDAKAALEGITNYKGEAYDIKFIGDASSTYTVDKIFDPALERDAFERHKGYCDEKHSKMTSSPQKSLEEEIEDFWRYEYNRESSIAAAIHAATRDKLGIGFGGKKESELTADEKATVNKCEQRRWNVYMRSEGYIKGKRRNDLGKVHDRFEGINEISDAALNIKAAAKTEGGSPETEEEE